MCENKLPNTSRGDVQFIEKKFVGKENGKRTRSLGHGDTYSGEKESGMLSRKGVQGMKGGSRKKLCLVYLRGGKRPAINSLGVRTIGANGGNTKVVQNRWTGCPTEEERPRKTIKNQSETLAVCGKMQKGIAIPWGEEAYAILNKKRLGVVGFGH